MRMRSPLSDRLYLIINLIMILIYAGAGVALFFCKTNLISDTSRKVFSGTLILYSIYRGFSLYRKIKTAADEN